MLKRILGVCLLLTLTAPAREWTSADGKRIEAEFLRLEGENIVLKMRGKEFTLALSRLSEGDQDFARKEAAEAQQQAAAAKTQLFGKTLQIGSVNSFELDLSEKAEKALSKNKLPPAKIKLQVLVPEGFDPTQPQMVFWPVGGINNEAERLKGNLARVAVMSAEALKAGYVVIAADTEHGNPRETTIEVQKADFAFHSDVIEKLTAEWPDFKGWSHACGGNSSGAKGSFFRIAHLLANDVKVVGGFFAGCNGCYAEQALEESGARSRAFKKVKAWVSTGDQDKLVSKQYNTIVTNAIESADYGEIRNEFFSGGHGMSQAELAKALAWFKE